MVLPCFFVLFCCFLDIVPVKYHIFSLWTISNIMVLYLGTTTVHFVRGERREVPTLPALLFDSPPPTQPISPPNSPTFSPSALIFCPCCGFESLQIVKRTGCADSTASRITIHYSFVCVREGGCWEGGCIFRGVTIIIWQNAANLTGCRTQEQGSGDRALSAG